MIAAGRLACTPGWWSLDYIPFAPPSVTPEIELEPLTAQRKRGRLNSCVGSAETLPSTEPTGIVSTMRSTETVQAMWDEVWNAHDPDAVDRFVTDDVVVVIGGKEISGNDDFKDSIRELLDNVEDLHLDAIETFQNAGGTRVTSRWVLTGANNGFLGTQPNHKPIAMTGTAIWEVRQDGKLTRNTVEQASFELYRYLLEK